MLKNTSSAYLPFTVGDAETPASGLAVTAVSSLQTLIPDGNLILGGAGSNRTVRLVPLSNQVGNATITLSVGDGTNVTTSMFTATVASQLHPTVTVTKTGSGSISPSLSKRTLNAGATYTLVATPASGYQFAGWSGSLSSTSPTLTFTLCDNLNLVATFVGVDASGYAGSYSGLFYEPGNIRVASSGGFKLTLGKNGAYSGSLQYASNKFSFSGTVSTIGVATGVIALNPSNTVALTVEFGRTNRVGQCWGSVTNAAYNASLLGQRAVYSSKTNSCPNAGTYAIVVPGQQPPTPPPPGSGSGTLTVSAAGAARVTATLPDATAFTASSTVLQQGQLPVFVPLYSGSGSVLGWLSFTNATVNGGLYWLKP
jgi:uncharacterized repeat protein (TIGR02543 family)